MMPANFPGSEDDRGSSTASIVVVMFNSERTIVECLDSIPEACEIILVDQCSSDSSIAVALQAQPRARLIKAGANRGFGTGCNLGAANATGEVLIFLNPDASFGDGCVDLLVDAAVNQDALAGPRIIDSDGTDETRARYWSRVRSDLAEVCFPIGLLERTFPRDIPKDDPVYRRGGRVPYIQGCCMAIRARNFWAAGGFDERLFLYHEEEMLARSLDRLDVHAVVVPHATVTHIGASSTSQLREFSAGQYYRSKAVFHVSHYPRPVATAAVFALWASLQIMASLTPVRSAVGLRADKGSSWYRAAAAGVVSGWRGRLVVAPPTPPPAAHPMPLGDGGLRSIPLDEPDGDASRASG